MDKLGESGVSLDATNGQGDLGFDWVSSDARRIRSLLATLFRLEKVAVTRCDEALLQKINRLVLGFVHITRIRRAISGSGGQIAGSGGAEGRLNLTRNGIYARLESNGLSIDDIRNEQLHIYDLIQKSSVLGPLARELAMAGDKILSTNAPLSH